MLLVEQSPYVVTGSLSLRKMLSSDYEAAATEHLRGMFLIGHERGSSLTILFFLRVQIPADVRPQQVESIGDGLHIACEYLCSTLVTHI
jgi:hypothetical protein